MLSSSVEFRNNKNNMYVLTSSRSRSGSTHSRFASIRTLISASPHPYAAWERSGRGGQYRKRRPLTGPAASGSKGTYEIKRARIEWPSQVKSSSGATRPPAGDHPDPHLFPPLLAQLITGTRPLAGISQQKDVGAKPLEKPAA